MKITHRPSALASADNRRLAATHFISYFHAHATWRLYVKADILVSESKTLKLSCVEMWRSLCSYTTSMQFMQEIDKRPFLGLPYNPTCIPLLFSRIAQAEF